MNLTISKLTLINLALTIFVAGMFFGQSRWGLLLLEAVVFCLTTFSIAIFRVDKTAAENEPSTF